MIEFSAFGFHERNFLKERLSALERKLPSRIRLAIFLPSPIVHNLNVAPIIQVLNAILLLACNIFHLINHNQQLVVRIFPNRFEVVNKDEGGNVAIQITSSAIADIVPIVGIVVRVVAVVAAISVVDVVICDEVELIIN